MHCLELTGLQPLVGHLLINWSEYGMNDPNQMIFKLFSMAQHTCFFDLVIAFCPASIALNSVEAKMYYTYLAIDFKNYKNSETLQSGCT